MEKLTSNLALLCSSLFYTIWLLIISHAFGSLNSGQVFVIPVNKLSDGHFSTSITKWGIQLSVSLLLRHESSKQEWPK